MRTEVNNDGQPVYGYLAGKLADDEGSALSTFILSVLPALKAQNEHQALAYAAAAFYLYFASGELAWLECESTELWNKLTDRMGFHCTVCNGLGHLSGRCEGVKWHVEQRSLVVDDPCYFTPAKINEFWPRYLKHKDEQENRSRRPEQRRRSRSPPRPAPARYPTGRPSSPVRGPRGGDSRQPRRYDNDRYDQRGHYRDQPHRRDDYQGRQGNGRGPHSGGGGSHQGGGRHAGRR
jgi:hypothetical protein